MYSGIIYTQNVDKPYRSSCILYSTAPRDDVRPMANRQFGCQSAIGQTSARADLLMGYAAVLDSKHLMPNPRRYQPTSRRISARCRPEKSRYLGLHRSIQCIPLLIQFSNKQCNMSINAIPFLYIRTPHTRENEFASLWTSILLNTVTHG